MRRLPIEFVFRYMENVLRARWGRAQNRKLLLPMIASFYLTMKCNFRCSYCDDGSGNMYPDITEERLNTKDTITVLEILRRASPGLSITGGEVTLRPDIDEIFGQIGRLGFCPVTFNTNAFLIDRHLSTLHHVDYLIISLDSIDERRSDGLINLRIGGQTKKVKDNINLIKDYKRRHKLKFDCIVNTVILPETIDDAWSVFEFCLENDFFWTPMPYIVGKYPCAGLVDNPRWQELIDEVIRAKRMGARIYGNLQTLRTIRDFKRFECYPTTHPTVYPNGDVYYPCAPLNMIAGNLLEIGDYNEAMRLGEQKHGPVPYCDSRCHVGCHLESSTVISYPQQGMLEVVKYAVQRSGKQFVLHRPTPAEIALPPTTKLRASPSLPPDKVRHLRQLGMLERDWTSAVAIRGVRNDIHFVNLTHRQP